MMNLTLNQKRLIGVIHLGPLPGSPDWSHNLPILIAHAIRDAKAYEKGGAHALIMENFGDAPFTKSSVAPETVAAMSTIAYAIRQETSLPLGINVLRNDAHAALAIATACGGDFIRVNVHTGAMLTDQGIIEGDAYHTLRLKKALNPNIQIWADVHVKHALPLAPFPIEETAHDTLERGKVDAIILSGHSTGDPVNLDELQRVRKSCPKAFIALGSGVTLQNIKTYLPYANGFIVGTSLKRKGQLFEPVEVNRVRALANQLRSK
ncbi:MAG: BtpA/SgcQ family protein [Verrucomicrobiia bacterium]